MSLSIIILFPGRSPFFSKQVSDRIGTNNLGFIPIDDILDFASSGSSERITFNLTHKLIWYIQMFIVSITSYDGKSKKID